MTSFLIEREEKQMPRKNLKIKPKPILFIACEGTSSEYQYFASWAETDEAREIFERVNVYPDENENRPKTTPYQLFQRAKEALDDGSANFAWAVFDKDNHPNLPKTFFEAKTDGVKIAFSSRSFEEWVLMHFEKNNNIFNATECKDAKAKPIKCGSDLVPNCKPINCLTGHIRRKNWISDYSKKKTFDLFTEIFNLTEIAIVNSAWLRFQTKASLNVPQPPLQTLNPYTDVDQLILKLHERLDKIEWGVTKTNVSLCYWTINTRIEKGKIQLQLSHTKPKAQLLNNVFIESSFFTTDDNLNNTSCKVLSKKYLLSKNGSTNQLLYKDDIIEYTLQSNKQPYFLFKDNDQHTRIYIIL